MAVSIVALTNGTGSTTVDNSSFSTGTISDAPSNTLLIARIASVRGNEVTANIPTCSGLGLTWTQVAATVLAASHTHRITLFRAVGTPSSGTVTFDFAGQTQASAGWSVYRVNETPTGNNGADAIVQQNTVDDSTNPVTVPLNAFADAVNNACFFTGLTLANEAPTAEGTLTALTSGNEGGVNIGFIDAWQVGEDTSPSSVTGANVHGSGVALEFDQLAPAIIAPAANQYYRRLAG